MAAFEEHNAFLLDPKDIKNSIAEIAQEYPLSPGIIARLEAILALFPAAAWMYVTESDAIFQDQVLLLDKFMFDLENDELILFANDAMTFVDGMIEMAMYLSGFLTLIGVDDEWMVEFAIGAWKPIKNRVKRRLNIPLPNTQWVIQMPDDQDTSLLDQQIFLSLFSELNAVSFIQMVRWAARDDVQVDFPPDAHPEVIEVYIRMKAAIEAVTEGLALEDWREFNTRLLTIVEQLNDQYQPRHLPLPDWEWLPAPEEAEHFDWLDDDALPSRLAENEVEPAPEPEAWNPFETFINDLFDREDPFHDRHSGSNNHAHGDD